METTDAKRYLAESKASYTVACARAAEDDAQGYWSAWATAFMNRIRTLEKWLSRNKV